MDRGNKFFGIFTQLLRKVGVAIGPNEIQPVKDKCNELVEEIRTIAREEATKIALEQTKEIKEAMIVHNPLQLPPFPEGAKRKKKN